MAEQFQHDGAVVHEEVDDELRVEFADGAEHVDALEGHCPVFACDVVVDLVNEGQVKGRRVLKLLELHHGGVELSRGLHPVNNSNYLLVQIEHSHPERHFIHPVI